MNRSVLVAVLVAAMGLAGCGERREPRPVDDTVFRDQVRALDKARTVEEQAEERKRKLDRDLEEDSGY